MRVAHYIQPDSYGNITTTMHEFEVINRFFKSPSAAFATIVRGIGDDAAVLTVPDGEHLVMTTDTLVAGTHFLPDASPFDIGYKSLAVSLSDIAAMGAKPMWVMLSLTLPSADASWLQAFSKGFFTLANQHTLALVGGDTTQGPLSITCQITGVVPCASQAIRRDTANAGDAIFVIGYLGGAGLALNRITQRGVQPSYALTEVEESALFLCLNRPTPQVNVGLALRGLASAAIDVSDGLLADLGHIAEQSQLGAHLFQDLFPLHPVVKNALPAEQAIELAVTAGDDYALCCTVPQDKRHQFLSALDALHCPYRYIGTMTETPGIKVFNSQAQPVTFARSGYRHYDDS